MILLTQQLHLYLFSLFIDPLTALSHDWEIYSAVWAQVTLLRLVGAWDPGLAKGAYGDTYTGKMQEQNVYWASHISCQVHMDSVRIWKYHAQKQIKKSKSIDSAKTSALNASPYTERD